MSRDRPTLGEIRMRSPFNPSADSEVDHFKKVLQQKNWSGKFWVFSIGIGKKQ